MEFTATEDRSIRPQSRNTLRQTPLNLLADDQMQKGLFFGGVFLLFFFWLKRAKKVLKCRSSKFAVSKHRQQQFPRGVRGDWRLQEIPEPAHISGADLRNFELERRDPVRSHPTGVSCRHATHRHVGVGGGYWSQIPKRCILLLPADFLLFSSKRSFFSRSNDPTHSLSPRSSTNR